MRFRDKLISTILVAIMLMLIVVIGMLGYTICHEIIGDGTVELNFLEGYSALEDKEHKSNAGTNLGPNIFDGVNNSTNPEKTETTSRYRNLYEQLNKYSKVIYTQLYEHREDLKTGTYTIEFGNTFSELLSQENGDDELEKSYQAAIEALIYENPEIFYIDATKMYINIEKITKITGVKYNVYINQGQRVNYLAEGFNSKEDVDRSIQQVEQVKNSILANLGGQSDYQKIKTIHDYLIDNIEYESTLQKSNIYNIYGALVEKTCVCEGYAKSFQYLMNEIGIDNAIVIGTATNSYNETENHAWNYVKLDGNWYAIDTTWDDPIIIGGGKLTPKLKYQYFLKGSKAMQGNHVPIGNFTDKGQTFIYPTLSITDYE